MAKALQADGPPQYERAPVKTSAWAQIEPAVRALLSDFPTMPATVIAERVGWVGGHSWFAENVTRIRPEYAPPDPCDRLVHLPGEQVQCDLWFPGQLVPDHAGVLRSFSGAGDGGRLLAVHRRNDDSVTHHRGSAGRDMAAHRREHRWRSSEPAVGQRVRNRSRRRLAQGVAGFCGVLGTRLIQARPCDPETRAVVERANGYLDTSFLPGRSFASPADSTLNCRAGWARMPTGVPTQAPG